MPSKEQDENKTGGDLNKGRMVPGAEGRGGHQVQRRPRIEGELTGELKKLFEKAKTVAEFLGHVPELWRSQPKSQSASLRCVECRVSSGIAINPMCDWEPDPNRPGRSIAVPRAQINGLLFEEKCKR